MFGQNWLYSGNWLYLSTIGCIGAKLVVFDQISCIWENLLYLGKNGCISAKLVVFGQIDCLLAK